MNGFPDWSNKEQYPAKPDDLTYTQWAWEFLRRNKSYQADYIAVQEISDVAERQRQSTQIARQYDLAVGLLDPLIVTAWQLPRACIFVRYPRFSVHEEDLHAPFKVSLTFDISLPLDPQLREAKEILHLRIEEQSKSKSRLFSNLPPLTEKRERVSFQNLVHYLRVLDAVEVGATEFEIATALFPKLDNDNTDKYAGNVRVQNHLKAAQKLRDGAYRKICLRNAEVYHIDEVKENSGGEKK